RTSDVVFLFCSFFVQCQNSFYEYRFNNVRSICTNRFNSKVIPNPTRGECKEIVVHSENCKHFLCISGPFLILRKSC
ncbi:hypothetical protein L9F63_002558, partial [Diploptera punctata]